MSILHQGTAPSKAAFAAAQHRNCGAANLPSSVDIERMLRADRMRANHFSSVASNLAAAWREVSQ